MSTLSWLHLSDLHFDSRSDFDRHVMQDAVCEDLKTLLEKYSISVQFVFVTGDVANTASEDDYRIAMKFFNKVSEIAKLNKTDIYIVPGNHDVNRLMVSRYCDDQRNGLVSRNDIRRTVEDNINEYLKRFDNYSKFIASFYSKPYAMDEDNYYFSEIRTVKDINIGIIGLNSAWACYGDRNDCNNIYISEPQILNAIEKVKNAELKIALLHHPLSWLYEVDKVDCEDVLLKHCDIILHGHLHRHNFHILNSARGGQIVIPAGEIFGDRRLTNSYNITQIDLLKKTITVFPRKYSDSNRTFFRDIDMIGADDKNFCRFKMPKKIAAKLS